GARLLREFVTAGGGLLVVAGEHGGSGSFTAETAALLPATIGNTIERTTLTGGKLTRIDFAPPIFEIFSSPRSGGFSSARFFRYRKLELRPDGQTGRRTDGQNDAGPSAHQPIRPFASVLASFDDGSPALVESKLGKGTVLLWASTLDNYWSDFPVQPVF